MDLDISNLPSEPSLLQPIILDLFSKLQDLDAKYKFLKEENKSLKEQLSLLQAKRYGSSSEKQKLDKQIEDIELRIEENESKIESLEKETTQPSNQARRKKIPDNIPREEILLSPDPKCPSCGEENFRKLGEDISEILEYVPSSYKVHKYIRPRCICNNCDTIVQAYPPSQAIDKGKAGSGLLSHILVQKYCNHLPFYRQSKMFEYEGINLSRSTLTSWGNRCAKLLQPLANEVSKVVFSSTQIHGDDTPVKVLAPGLGKTKTGRIWTYVKDGRPHGDNKSLAVCYYYSPDRKGERPAEHLKHFKGTLHADAYAGYNKLYISDKNPNSGINEAGCWSHTRRKFYEIVIINDKAVIATQVLEQIQKIYKVEEEIKGLAPDQRAAVRQEKSNKLVAQLFAYFRKAKKLLPKKSRTALAIQYALNNEKSLTRFLDNGKIEIDNNTAERAMRGIALGRKNWLCVSRRRYYHEKINI